MNGGAEQTKGLAKYLLVVWQWRFMVNVVDFCPPTPSMLDISQLLDGGADLKDNAAWILAYMCTLQCMGEATQGQRWPPLVDTFILETGAELTEGDITVCWCLGVGKVPPQKRDSPFANVTMCLDELARHELSCTEWDKLDWKNEHLEGFNFRLNSLKCSKTTHGHSKCSSSVGQKTITSSR